MPLKSINRIKIVLMAANEISFFFQSKDQSNTMMLSPIIIYSMRDLICDANHCA